MDEATVRADAQAQCRLYPPQIPSTFNASPHTYIPGQLRRPRPSLTVLSLRPPEVTCEFSNPRLPERLILKFSVILAISAGVPSERAITTSATGRLRSPDIASALSFLSNLQSRSSITIFFLLKSMEGIRSTENSLIIFPEASALLYMPESCIIQIPETP